MRILIALTYYRPHYSGLTIYTERQARALSARGHHVIILTSRFDPNLPAHEIINGIEIIRPRVLFRLSKGVIMPSMPFWALNLVKQVDIVQVHVPQLDAALIAIYAHMLGKPLVLTYHCDLQLPRGLIHRLANQVSNFANHITARFADVIVHNTKDYAENSPFLKKYIHKVEPVYPPIKIAKANQNDLDTFRKKYQIKTDEHLIGIAARLATEKGVEYLAQALPKVLEKHPQSRVLFIGPYQDLVGEEEYAKKVQRIIEPIQDHWTFLGVLSPKEMAAFFNICDVTVLPSINSTESFGMVQVESITCGTPVIATDLPGIRIPVRESCMGIIVPPANAQALAQAINTVLDKPGDFQGNAVGLIEHSKPQAVAIQYEKIYQKLIS